MRVLVIEDDKDLNSYICKGLKEQGCNVDSAEDGKQGLFLATTEKYDALVIDRMLPEVDGLTIIRTIRASNNQTPALILSALGQVDDRVKGLKAGGDDYVVKPFAFTELMARLEAISRRRNGLESTEETKLSVADLEMDLLSRKIYRSGKEIEIQSREFKLLEYLLRHKGQVVTRTMLLEQIWDYNFDPQTNVIDVHISRLRSKIEKGFDKPIIKTIRGTGYIVEDK
ncbi:MAG: DNA-binding response regulator [Alphaproteobacteria bacterium CG11_big_fil_rev_8_21_14_0_20_44_7]|nr:MAG: DNA-binding response regulator [Alphaproteobacteria bacterium CG11_big_fil_rev_8_21_14_0_20_44_7]